jgi:molybdenum cofactor cytidylyltransferase
MGRPKALLRCPPEGRTFVGQLIHTLRHGGLDRVAVVGRAHDAALREEVSAATPPVAYIENLSPDLGQLSSVLAGIAFAEAEAGAGALVVPVDMPLIRAETVKAALAAFDRSDEPILRVRCGGRNGHPVIFGARVFPMLRSTAPAAGARAVLNDHPSLVRTIDVDDPGVLRDIDLPAEYRALFDPDPS